MFVVPIRIHKYTNARKRFCDGSSFAEVITQAASRYGKFILPVCNTKSLSIVFVQFYISLISRLFTSCRPFAIFRAVWAIIIDSLYCITAGRAWAHIVKKMDKGLPPSRRYGNTSTAIIGIGAISWIITTINNMCPNPIFRSPASSMFCVLLNSPLALEAAATLSFPIPQELPRESSYHTAIASTPPSCSIADISPGVSFENEQPTKLLTIQIDKIWHEYLSLWFGKTHIPPYCGAQ